MTQSFQSFGLPPKLLEALTHMRFETPTPIQNATIPVALEGHDILGSAQTGTGKTGAFAIPILAKLMEMPDKAALIMTPTRELGSQVLAAFKQMIKVPNLKTALLIGGEPMVKQLSQLKQKPRIIVGTPGRINDHLDRGTLRLNQVAFLVLDETDRMLDLGFDVQIESIISQMPAERQTLMFSATIAPNIARLSSQYLNHPKRISVGSTTQAAPNIQQEVIKTVPNQKHGHLLKQLEENEGSTIIFVKTKRDTERLADRLKENGYDSEAIHGDLKQSKRDRVIRSFRARKFDILVATDVAARGLDVPHIELVVNYDLPQVPEDYIHRIGRTARAGATGKAVNLITSEDGNKWRAITRLMDPKSKSQGLDEAFEGGPRRTRKPSHNGDWKQSWKDQKKSDGPRDGARFSRDSSFGGDRGRRPFKDNAGRGERPHFSKPREDFGREGFRPSAENRYPKDSSSFRNRSSEQRGSNQGERNFSDQPKRNFGNESRPFRENDRPKRSFGNQSRSFNENDRPKRSFGPARSNSSEAGGFRRGAPKGASQSSENWLDSIFVDERGAAPVKERGTRSNPISSKPERESAKKTKTTKKPKKRINQLNFAA